MKIKLSELKHQEEARIEDIDEELRTKVAGMGIRKGKKVKMLTKQPLKGPIIILIDGNNTSLARAIADRIIVEVAK